MTVIVYRDGVMASDTMCRRGGLKTYGEVKMVRGADGSVHGGSGSVGAFSKYVEWVKGGEVGEMPLPGRDSEGHQSFGVMVARPDGSVWLLDEHALTLDVAPCAAGSGAEIAYGALFMGASAADAVRAAIHHADGCGGEVVEMRVGDAAS